MTEKRPERHERGEKRKWLVTLTVDIEPETMRQVVEEGRVSEFVNAFPALAAGHLKAQVVEQLARGEFGEAVLRYDDDFWTGPPPPPFIDTVPLPESEWGLRFIVRDELRRIR